MVTFAAATKNSSSFPTRAPGQRRVDHFVAITCSVPSDSCGLRRADCRTHAQLVSPSRDPVGCHIALNLYQLAMALHSVDPSGNVALILGATGVTIVVVVVVVVVAVGVSSASCALLVRGGLTQCLGWASHCYDRAAERTNEFVGRECPATGFPNILKEVDCYNRIYEPNSQLCTDELNRCRARVYRSCGIEANKGVRSHGLLSEGMLSCSHAQTKTSR